MWVCEHACICAHAHMCLWRPEEGMVSREARVTSRSAWANGAPTFAALRQPGTGTEWMHRPNVCAGNQTSARGRILNC